MLNHFLVAQWDALAQVEVGIKLAQADGAKKKGLGVRLVEQVGSVHQTLEVRAVRHAKHMAELMAGCFHGSVLCEVLELVRLRIRVWLLADVQRVTRLLHVLAQELRL